LLIYALDYGRWPLMDPASDGPVGAIYGRELTEAILDGDDDAPVDHFRHNILIVPPNVPLDVLLARMQDERASLCAPVPLPTYDASGPT